MERIDSQHIIKDRIVNLYEKNRTLIHMLLIYTIAFAFVFLLGFRVFLFEYDKGFIWYIDGVKQHFPFLVDMSQMIKEFISQPFNGFKFWSWEMGFGADVIHSYTYYVLGDPISMAVAAFLPLASIESGYFFMVVFRLYLVGASMLFYCRHMSLKVIPSVVAALIYAFSLHMIFWGLRHPFFINGAYILPFLYIGIDKILQQKKPYLFILAIAYCALNNFYFFYMNTVAVVIYALIRYIYLFKGKKKLIGTFFKLFFRTFFYYILGIMISSILFIPTVYGFLNTNRGLNYPLSFQLYDMEYITRIFSNLFSFHWDAVITELTISSIAVPCVLLAMFFVKKEFKSHRILFLLYTVLLIFPIVHSMFNGFSTPNLRWMYIYIMLISFLTAVTLNNIDKINIRGILLMGISMIIYVKVFYTLNDIQDRYFLIAILAALAFIASLFIYRIRDLNIKQLPRKIKNKKRIINILVLNSIILILVALNLAANIHGIMGQKRYGGEYEDKNTVTTEFNQDITASINELIQDDDFYRVEYNDSRNNKQVYHNFKGSNFFNSIINKNMMDLFLKHSIRTNFYNSGYIGLDNISALESILGMKYYIVDEGSEYVLPYGFVEHIRQGETVVYSNPNVLPLGFVYYQGVESSQLAKKNDIYKTQVMMDAVIVEDIASIDIQRYPVDNTIKEIPFTIEDLNGVEINGSEVNVDQKNGEMIIATDEIVDGELYLEINDIYHNDPETSYRVNVYTDKGKKFEETLRSSSAYYMDNHDYLINLGYDAEHDKSITLEFPKIGEYTVDSIRLYAVDMKDYDKKITRLKDTPLENIEYGNNYVEGYVTTLDKGVLFLSIPYSKGWHAYVNGKKVDTIKVNTSFTGIQLDKGSYEIELRYRSPWFITSVIISLLGVLIFIGIVVLDKKT